MCIYCEFLIFVHVFIHLCLELKFWIDYVDERAYYIQGSDLGSRFRVQGDV